MLYALTYLKVKGDFHKFANSLGEKLLACNDSYSAIICFILSENYERCVGILHENYIKDCEKINKYEKQVALQNLFEEVLSIKYIMEFNARNETTDQIFMEYCEMLINLNLSELAYNYLVKIGNQNNKIQILLDRIYGNSEEKLSKKEISRNLCFHLIL